MGKAITDATYAFMKDNYDKTKAIIANARDFFEINNERSVKGWESALRGWLQRNPNHKVASPVKEVNETTQLNKAYFYDTVNDVYITYLSVAGDMISVEGDKHRAMKTAYSGMVGKASSINEISREFGIPRAWFDEYRRRHGWTHDMDIYTDEQIENNDVEQLVEDLVLQRRRELHKGFEKKKWKEIEEDANKYRVFEDTLLSEFRELITNELPPITPFELEPSQHDYSLVVSPTDFHWGKHGWVDEVGDKYDFDTARYRLMEKTTELIARLPGKPEQIILATGSDWFHVDTDAGTTTKGTPQDMCGSPAQILMTGCMLAREDIELLRTVSPVKVVFMPGNHDRMTAFALMMYLSAVYEDVDDCEVIVSAMTRQYVQYGNNLIGFIHGDKKMDLASIMSNEQREVWGKCEHRTWFHGHLHHQKVNETKGCMIIQLPSLAGHDRYHYRAGYVESKAGLAAHIIDKEKGVTGSLFAPVGGH